MIYIVSWLFKASHSLCPNCGGWEEQWKKVFTAKDKAIAHAKKITQNAHTSRCNVKVTEYDCPKASAKTIVKVLNEGTSALSEGTVVWKQ